MFSNTQLDIESLPDVRDVSLKKVHRDFNKVILMEWIIFWSIVFALAIVSVFTVFSHTDLIIKIVICFSVLLLAAIVRLVGYFSFKLKSYAIREQDIIYKTGWPVTKFKTIPFSRIQDSELVQGFIAKKYSIAKIKINTASTGGDITIRGLKTAEAEMINQFIIDKIGNE